MGHGDEAACLAGRTRERELLRRLIRGTVEGTPGVVLVHGEPGVGKTRLVTAMTEHARLGGHAVLWGRCLRFGAASSPYLPFVSAFESGLADGLPVEGRDLKVLYGAAETAEPVPRGIHVVDRVVARLVEQRPVVLVVDDLQWADASSLDALAYLIAGMRRQPLAVLVTYRDTGLADGHPLHAWLADMLRMPGVRDLPLARLDEEATAEQLRHLLRGRPQAALVTQVWERSGGNPYLTELLAGELEPRADVLPDDIPAALRSALSAQWHALETEARQVTQVLAVAGRPVDSEVLAGVVPTVDVGAALHRAEVGGVVQRDRDGRVWFRHPLLADVLYTTLLPDEVRRLHRTFVEVLSVAEPSTGARAWADLALHQTGAGMVDEAFETSLAASAEAARGGARQEAVVLLRRATDLWEEVTPAVRERHGSLPALLADLGFQAFLVGDADGATAAIRRARALVDERHDPLLAARLVRLEVLVRHAAGEADPPLAESRRAVRLAAADPDSAEYAHCLADYADHLMWSGEADEALRRATEAVAVAKRSGDEATRSLALAALASVQAEDPSAEELAREAVRLAGSAGRRELEGVTTIALVNVLDSQGRLAEAADILAAAAARCQGLVVAGLLGTYAATYLLPLGRLAEAEEILRNVLATRPGGMQAIQAREAALVVAVRTGQLDAASLHLDRLRELAPDFERHVAMHGPSALAEYLLAVGRPQEALDMLARTVERHSVAEPTYADGLLLWAARAAAALPPAGRGAGLDRVRSERDKAALAAFDDRHQDPVQRAVRALYDAESARCRGEPDVVERWREAVSLADTAGLRFDAADARLRLAEALLAGRHRQDAAGPLREAVAMAEEMGATPLRDEVVSVATTARVGLDAPADPDPVVAHGHGLTGREQEILGHLVAGRTYAEIAKALVISEKTVSVHVSNLLRKTGTSSRVEAAAWARRSGAVAG